MENSLLDATEEGMVDAVKHLLNSPGRNDVNVRHPQTADTPLIIASEKGHLEIVYDLLNHGADVTAQNVTNTTAIHAAASRDHVDIINVLYKHGGDLNAINNAGMSPLHLAVQRKYIRSVKLLLRLGADTNLCDKTWHRAPLYDAVKQGDFRMAQMLVEKDAAVNVQDVTGSTPLHEAVADNNLHVARLLLKYGADINVKENITRSSPLNQVKSSEMKQLLTIFVQKASRDSIRERRYSSGSDSGAHSLSTSRENVLSDRHSYHGSHENLLGGYMFSVASSRSLADSAEYDAAFDSFRTKHSERKSKRSASLEELNKIPKGVSSKPKRAIRRTSYFGASTESLPGSKPWKDKHSSSKSIAGDKPEMEVPIRGNIAYISREPVIKLSRRYSNKFGKLNSDMRMKSRSLDDMTSVGTMWKSLPKKPGSTRSLHRYHSREYIEPKETYNSNKLFDSIKPRTRSFHESWKHDPLYLDEKVFTTDTESTDNVPNNISKMRDSNLDELTHNVNSQHIIFERTGQDDAKETLDKPSSKNVDPYEHDAESQNQPVEMCSDYTNKQPLHDDSETETSVLEDHIYAVTEKNTELLNENEIPNNSGKSLNNVENYEYKYSDNKKTNEDIFVIFDNSIDSNNQQSSDLHISVSDMYTVPDNRNMSSEVDSSTNTELKTHEQSKKSDYTSTFELHICPDGETNKVQTPPKYDKSTYNPYRTKATNKMMAWLSNNDNKEPSDERTKSQDENIYLGNNGNPQLTKEDDSKYIKGDDNQLTKGNGIQYTNNDDNGLTQEPAIDAQSNNQNTSWNIKESDNKVNSNDKDLPCLSGRFEKSTDENTSWIITKEGENEMDNGDDIHSNEEKDQNDDYSVRTVLNQLNIFKSDRSEVTGLTDAQKTKFDPTKLSGISYAASIGTENILTRIDEISNTQDCSFKPLVSITAENEVSNLEGITESLSISDNDNKSLLEKLNLNEEKGQVADIDSNAHKDINELNKLNLDTQEETLIDAQKTKHDTTNTGAPESASKTENLLDIINDVSNPQDYPFDPLIPLVKDSELLNSEEIQTSNLKPQSYHLNVKEDIVIELQPQQLETIETNNLFEWMSDPMHPPDIASDDGKDKSFMSNFDHLANEKCYRVPLEANKDTHVDEKKEDNKLHSDSEKQEIIIESTNSCVKETDESITRFNNEKPLSHDSQITNEQFTRQADNTYLLENGDNMVSLEKGHDVQIYTNSEITEVPGEKSNTHYVEATLDSTVSIEEKETENSEDTNLKDYVIKESVSAANIGYVLRDLDVNTNSLTEPNLLISSKATSDKVEAEDDVTDTVPSKSSNDTSVDEKKKNNKFCSDNLISEKQETVLEFTHVKETDDNKDIERFNNKKQLSHDSQITNEHITKQTDNTELLENGNNTVPLEKADAKINEITVVPGEESDSRYVEARLDSKVMEETVEESEIKNAEDANLKDFIIKELVTDVSNMSDSIPNGAETDLDVNTDSMAKQNLIISSKPTFDKVQEEDDVTDDGDSTKVLRHSSESSILSEDIVEASPEEFDKNYAITNYLISIQNEDEHDTMVISPDMCNISEVEFPADKITESVFDTEENINPFTNEHSSVACLEPTVYEINNDTRNSVTHVHENKYSSTVHICLSNQKGGDNVSQNNTFGEEVDTPESDSNYNVTLKEAIDQIIFCEENNSDANGENNTSNESPVNQLQPVESDRLSLLELSKSQCNQATYVHINKEVSTENSPLDDNIPLKMADSLIPEKAERSALEHKYLIYNKSNHEHEELVYEKENQPQKVLTTTENDSTNAEYVVNFEHNDLMYDKCHIEHEGPVPAKENQPLKMSTATENDSMCAEHVDTVSFGHNDLRFDEINTKYEKNLQENEVKPQVIIEHNTIVVDNGSIKEENVPMNKDHLSFEDDYYKDTTDHSEFAKLDINKETEQDTSKTKETDLDKDCVTDLSELGEVKDQVHVQSIPATITEMNSDPILNVQVRPCVNDSSGLVEEKHQVHVQNMPATITEMNSDLILNFHDRPKMVDITKTEGVYVEESEKDDDRVSPICDSVSSQQNKADNITDYIVNTKTVSKCDKGDFIENDSGQNVFNKNLNEASLHQTTDTVFDISDFNLQNKKPENFGNPTLNEEQVEKEENLSSNEFSNFDEQTPNTYDGKHDDSSTSEIKQLGSAVVMEPVSENLLTSYKVHVTSPGDEINKGGQNTEIVEGKASQTVKNEIMLNEIPVTEKQLMKCDTSSGSNLKLGEMYIEPLQEYKSDNIIQTDQFDVHQSCYDGEDEKFPNHIKSEIKSNNNIQTDTLYIKGEKSSTNQNVTPEVNKYKKKHQNIADLSNGKIQNETVQLVKLQKKKHYGAVNQNDGNESEELKPFRSPSLTSDPSLSVTPTDLSVPLLQQQTADDMTETKKSNYEFFNQAFDGANSDISDKLSDISEHTEASVEEFKTSQSMDTLTVEGKGDDVKDNDQNKEAKPANSSSNKSKKKEQSSFWKRIFGCCCWGDVKMM